MEDLHPSSCITCSWVSYRWHHCYHMHRRCSWSKHPEKPISVTSMQMHSLYYKIILSPQRYPFGLLLNNKTKFMLKVASNPVAPSFFGCIHITSLFIIRMLEHCWVSLSEQCRVKCCLTSNKSMAKPLLFFLYLLLLTENLVWVACKTSSCACWLNENYTMT